LFIDVAGDSLTSVNWINGIWESKKLDTQPLTSECQKLLADLQVEGFIAPRARHEDYVRHVYREYNKRADLLATRVLEGAPLRRCCLYVPWEPIYLAVQFDGGVRRRKGASAWHLSGAARRNPETGEPQWALLAESGVKLRTANEEPAEVLKAELTALREGLRAIDIFCRTGSVTLDSEGWVRY